MSAGLTIARQSRGGAVTVGTEAYGIGTFSNDQRVSIGQSIVPKPACAVTIVSISR